MGVPVGPTDPLGAALEQSLFREVNERLRYINEGFGDFVCECANGDCSEHVVMTQVEYEDVRRDSTHFLVTPGPGHVFPDVERVSEENDRYVVVEKFGEAGDAAVRLDRRRSGSAE